MMQGARYLGHIGPVPLYVHWSVLVLLYMGFFVWGQAVPALGASIVLALVVGIVLHELGHAFVGLLYGARDVSVTLWALGGVCMSTRERQTHPWREVAILVAGPAVSFAIWGVCFLIYGWLRVHHPDWLIDDQTGKESALAMVIGYMAIVNLMLGIFNCLPIWPLDGGQTLFQIQRGCGLRARTAGLVTLCAGYLAAAGFLYWIYHTSGQLPRPWTLMFIILLLYSSTMSLRNR